MQKLIKSVIYVKSVQLLTKFPLSLLESGSFSGSSSSLLSTWPIAPTGAHQQQSVVWIRTSFSANFAAAPPDSHCYYSVTKRDIISFDFSNVDRVFDRTTPGWQWLRPCGFTPCSQWRNVRLVKGILWNFGQSMYLFIIRMIMVCTLLNYILWIFISQAFDIIWQFVYENTVK